MEARFHPPDRLSRVLTVSATQRVRGLYAGLAVRNGRAQVHSRLPGVSQPLPTDRSRHRANGSLQAVLAAMMQLELPHVSVLSKMDLLKERRSRVEQLLQVRSGIRPHEFWCRRVTPSFPVWCSPR